MVFTLNEARTVVLSIIAASTIVLGVGIANAEPVGPSSLDVTTSTAVWEGLRNETLQTDDFSITAVANSAFAISDAELIGVGNDAYDDVFGFAVNTMGINDDDRILDLSSIADNFKVVIDPVFPSGLSGQLQYVMFDSPAVVQVYLSITNNGTEVMNTAIEHGGNLGSDDDAAVVVTGNGDTAFDAADSFVVFEDTSGSDPFVTFVIFGDDALETPTTSGLFNDNVNWLFDLTLAPEETQSLLFFGVMSGSATEGSALASTLDSLAGASDAGFLTGLSQDQLNTIVNYGVIPEPSTLCLLGLTGAGVLVRRRTHPLSSLLRSV